MQKIPLSYNELRSYIKIKRIDESIKKKYPDAKLVYNTDINNDYYVYYTNIDLLFKKKYYYYLTGRGDTFYNAYKDLCSRMMDKNFRLRYKTKFYATTPIRNIIKRYKIL